MNEGCDQPGSGSNDIADNFQVPTIEIISSDIVGSGSTSGKFTVGDWINARSGDESKWIVEVDWSIDYILHGT